MKWAGYQTLGAVEVDPVAAESYRQNHPSVHVWELDIRKLTCSKVLQTLNLLPGDLDLLAACPPCQGFSRLRTRNGRSSEEDPRNNLVDDVLRFVRVLRPKAVMLENVPGLAHDARFTKTTSVLRQRGYSLEWRIVDAAEYGVPQRRKRLVLVASRVGRVQFPEPTGRTCTVRETIGHLPYPRRSRDPLHNVSEKRAADVVERIKKIPRNGGSRRDIPESQQLACHRRLQGFGDVYGRMAWDAVSPTITSGCLNPSKGRFLHPSQSRAITPREAALLQSFPDDYWFSAKRGKEHLALQIGNAFPPIMIKEIAQPKTFKLDGRG